MMETCEGDWLYPDPSGQLWVRIQNINKFVQAQWDVSQLDLAVTKISASLHTCEGRSWIRVSSLRD